MGLALAALGGLRIQQQRYKEAEPLLRESLTAFERSAPDGWQRFNCQSTLGASLAGQQRYAEGEELLVTG